MFFGDYFQVNINFQIIFEHLLVLNVINIILTNIKYIEIKKYYFVKTILK